MDPFTMLQLVPSLISLFTGFGQSEQEKILNRQAQQQIDQSDTAFGFLTGDVLDETRNLQELEQHVFSRLFGPQFGAPGLLSFQDAGITDAFGEPVSFNNKADLLNSGALEGGNMTDLPANRNFLANLMQVASLMSGQASASQRFSPAAQSGQLGLQRQQLVGDAGLGAFFESNFVDDFIRSLFERSGPTPGGPNSVGG